MCGYLAVEIFKHELALARTRHRKLDDLIDSIEHGLPPTVADATVKVNGNLVP